MNFLVTKLTAYYISYFCMVKICLKSKKFLIISSSKFCSFFELFLLIAIIQLIEIQSAILSLDYVVYNVFDQTARNASSDSLSNNSKTSPKTLITP